MKFCYRGISYEKDQLPVMSTEGEIDGKYRGQNCKYRYPRHVAQSHSPVNRQYRGINYNTPTSSGDFSASLTGQFCHLSAKKPHKVTVSQISEAHLENLRRNLERRLQAAQAKGDDNLVQLLQTESQQLALKILTDKML